MSATAPASAPRARESLRLRVMAALVLIGLAALAFYTLFSGPTTVPLPAQPQGAPVQSAPPAQWEGEGRSEKRD